MSGMPDGIVTVHINGKRYRGSYSFRGEELVVTAHGLGESSSDLAVLGEDRGKAAVNLAKLVLIKMVREALDGAGDAGLSLQGSSTRIQY